MTETASAKAKSKKITVAFYNLENLFDTKNDPNTFDDDFTPEGVKNWNTDRYKTKLRKLSKVIAQIGPKKSNQPPVLLGVAEVENSTVLVDLTATKKLKPHNYGVIHHDSLDERGIDVGLLYQKEHFEVITSESIPIYLKTDEGKRDYTRDILHVTGKLHNNLVHVLINHWPSRRGGEEETQHNRIAAAQANRTVIDTIKAKDPDARLIIMGDFNDDPHSESVKNHLVKEDLYNPMVFLLTRYEGSLNHAFKWYLFDQIILSANFMQIHNNPLRYDKSKIYNDNYLTEFKGKFKGNPFRTYAGKRYLGGYSDHFPVYSVFSLKA